jgi:hypothetical protein
MNRRTFLKVAGVTAASVAVGVTGMKVVTILTKNQLEALKAGFAERLIQHLGKTQSKLLAQKIEQELENTLSQLPNIGTTKENRWATNMVTDHRVLSTRIHETSGFCSLK